MTDAPFTPADPGDLVTVQAHLATSLNLIAPVADQMVAAFYTRLFAEHPDIRPMFPRSEEAMAGQGEKLVKAIVALVTHFAAPEQLTPALMTMGRRHEQYGVRLEHYAAVGTVLLATLRDFAGDAWTPTFEQAWSRAYTFAAGVMMQAGALSGRTTRVNAVV